MEALAIKPPGRWRSGCGRGAISEQTSPEKAWLSADPNVRLAVRANRCVMHCLRNAGRGELSSLLAQPHGREALAETLATVGGLVSELFALCTDLVGAEEQLALGDSSAKLAGLNSRWQALGAENGGARPLQSPAARPATAFSAATAAEDARLRATAHAALPELSSPPRAAPGTAAGGAREPYRSLTVSVNMGEAVPSCEALPSLDSAPSPAQREAGAASDAAELAPLWAAENPLGMPLALSAGRSLRLDGGGAAAPRASLEALAGARESRRGSFGRSGAAGLPVPQAGSPHAAQQPAAQSPHQLRVALARQAQAASGGVLLKGRQSQAAGGGAAGKAAGGLVPEEDSPGPSRLSRLHQSAPHQTAPLPRFASGRAAALGAQRRASEAGASDAAATAAGAHALPLQQIAVEQDGPTPRRQGSEQSQQSSLAATPTSASRFGCGRGFGGAASRASAGGARPQVHTLLAAALRCASELDAAADGGEGGAGVAAAAPAAGQAAAAASARDGSAAGPVQGGSAATWLPPPEWSRAELRTFRRLQALVWLLRSAPEASGGAARAAPGGGGGSQPRRRAEAAEPKGSAHARSEGGGGGQQEVQAVLERVHAAFAHMQIGEEGPTASRLYCKTPHSKLLSCWLPKPAAAAPGTASAPGSVPPSPIQIQVGSQQDVNFGLVGALLSAQPPAPRLFFNASADERYQPEVDGDLVEGQSLLSVPISAGGLLYVLTLATKPNAALRDEHAQPLAELRAFAETVGCHLQACLAALHAAWARAGSARGRLTATASRLALRLALRNELQRSVTKKAQLESGWYYTTARVTSEYIPMVREMHSLVEVQRQIFAARSIDELTDDAMARVRALVRAERSTLYTHDWRRRTLNACLLAGMASCELK